MNSITIDAENFIKELLNQIICRNNDVKNAEKHHMESNNSNYSSISKIIYEKWKTINQTINYIFQRNKEENKWCRLLVEYDTKERNL